MLFDQDSSLLAAQVERHRTEIATNSGLAEVVPPLEAGRQPDSREHFGFADGIAQPLIEGTRDPSKEQERTGRLPTMVKAGEFLLGYRNEYGQLSDVPTVAVERDRGRLLPEVSQDQLRGLTTSHPGARDLGLNGTYLVFRQLAQDVAGFWRFLDETARALGHSDPAWRQYLGAKLVGRWPSGVPLVKAPGADPLADTGELSTDDDFDYAAVDPQGFACPVGAHIRRANPRDSLFTAHTHPEQAASSAQRHLLLRRGRSYGDRLMNIPVGETLPTDDGVERGLFFICLNADLERQFEFVQQTWINNPVFGGLHGEVDPLIGDPDKGQAHMTIPRDPLRTRVHDVGRFVAVKGGAYFFLPGRKALQYLASL